MVCKAGAVVGCIRLQGHSHQGFSLRLWCLEACCVALAIVSCFAGAQGFGSLQLSPDSLEETCFLGSSTSKASPPCPDVQMLGTAQGLEVPRRKSTFVVPIAIIQTTPSTLLGRKARCIDSSAKGIMIHSGSSSVIFSVMVLLDMVAPGAVCPWPGCRRTFPNNSAAAGVFRA